MRANVWIGREAELGDTRATARFAACVPTRDSRAHGRIGGSGRGPGDSMSPEEGAPEEDTTLSRSGPFQPPTIGARTSAAISRRAAERPRSSHLERRLGLGAGLGEGPSLELPGTLSLKIASPHPVFG
jgi:hypothetical protein